MARLNCLLVLATLLALALSASIKQEKKELDKKQTELIKRLLDLYEKRAELKHEEELEEDKRTFGVEAEKRHEQLSEMMQSYIDKRSNGFMMINAMSKYVMSFHNDEHDDTWKNTYKEYIVALYNSVKIIITDPTQIDIWLDDDSVSLKLMGGGTIINAQFATTKEVEQKSMAYRLSGYSSYAVFGVAEGVVSDSAMTSSQNSDIDDAKLAANSAELRAKAVKLLEAAGQMADSAGSSGFSFMYVKSAQYEVKYYKDEGFIVIAV